MNPIPIDTRAVEAERFWQLSDAAQTSGDLERAYSSCWRFSFVPGLATQSCAGVMAELRRALTLLMFLAAPVASAGDLTTLPTTDAGFREKIAAFIKPGGNLEDGLRLLEAHRFECRVFDHHKDPLYHCSRMDEPRFYQVMIESRAAVVKTVEPSVGRLSR